VTALARLSRGALAVAVAVASAGAMVRSASADDMVPVQVDYEPRPGCPTSDAFVQEVLVRAPRARLATTAERARTLVVRIRSAAAGGLQGTLIVRDLEGRLSERVVHAKECTELATALAVIAAIVIDPLTAKGGGGDTPDGGASDSASTPVTATTATNATTASGDAKDGAALPADDRANGDAASTRPQPSDGSASSEWTATAGAGGGVVGGASPVVLFSVPLFVEVSRAVSEIVEPTVRLRFERTSLGVVSRNAGGADFALTTGAADLCPIALHDGALRLQPCLRVEVGALSARGRDVEPTRSEARPWFTLGLLGRARYAIAKPIFVELEGALLVPAVRDRFFVEPNAPIYRPPALGASAALAVGVTF
jgi:hypothetical protein